MIPTALVSCLFTLIFSALCVTVAGSAMFPGSLELSNALLPMSYGFSKAFSISFSASSWFSLSPMIASLFAFMFSFDRQISAMARSGLLPEIFKLTIGANQTHYVSLGFGVVAAFAALLVPFEVQMDRAIYVFYFSMFGTFFVYLSLLAGYIVFHFKYPTLPRSFRSPFKAYGALYGIFVFVVDLIALVGWTPDGRVPLYCFIVSILFAVIYYLSVARYHQAFSSEEQQTMFVAYVINGK